MRNCKEWKLEIAIITYEFLTNIGRTINQNTLYGVFIKTYVNKRGCRS